MQEKGERRMEKGASTMVAILTAGEGEQRQKERKRERGGGTEQIGSVVFLSRMNLMG